MTPTRSAFALVTSSTLVMLALAGCSSGNTVAAPHSAPSVEMMTTPSAGPPATPPGIAPPDEVVDATLPAGLDPESDTALAWQALMSPVGEYAAAASYLAVLDRFGLVEPYATILEGELRHIDALTRQLERSGVEVPDNPYLGVVVAPDDLQTAAEAWAVGEVDNVAMYDELLAQADDSRLVMVLSNLRRASLESHLPLFEAAAAAGGTLEEFPGHTP